MPSVSDGPIADEGQFPTIQPRMGKGFAGTGEVRRRAMRVSSERYQAATPFLADAGSGIRGPRLGLDKTGGGYFHFDAWEFYRARWITGTSMVQIGGVGAGKSTTGKTVARRAIGQGRKVALPSDPKGEWVPVARTVHGSQILSLGAGRDRVNPLDEGLRPSGMSSDDWAAEIHTRRQQLIVAIVSIMRGGQLMSDDEHDALDTGLRDVEADRGVPTIRRLIAKLEQLDGVDDEVKRAGRTLARGLRRTVSGDLAGMFDEESTVSFDMNAPMLVINTETLMRKPANVRAVASACASRWIDSIVRDRSSGYWYVISEEGWSEMRDPRAVELMDERQRMAGDDGTANWLIMHEIEDLNQVGPEGSAQRAQALGLLSKAQIKIVHKQSETAIDATVRALRLSDREGEKVLNLDQGEALWKIGKRSLIVRSLITRKEWEVFNTDERRGGL